ncbi:Chitin synthase regulatory factor-like protein [Hapsidospora chrysogenum ATCC 11550]|uniref:Chitin synthase regulatory factor-like protein n=1 Tax=Hapsidospora chrysogenum (strain ATCC 11550 / CBS 779.69 / DSM 880 / IAM 14645 / JCM 23072 / IMI 49137) TaxID=857340 RepID=A0A086T2K2_HAPC1|nr:Chitin synthase regulatory factor-like protein [Hapsidospora chrysogenum ATCC 11550]
MSGMDLNGQRGGPSSSRTSAEGDYGQPSMGGRGPPRDQHQEHFGPRAGPPEEQDPGGYAGYDDRYGRAPAPQQPNHEFGPPGRSMTMPNGPAASWDMHPQQRANTMAYDSPAGRGMPQRPSSATGSRPPPRGGYPMDNQGYGNDPYGGGYDGGQGYVQHQRGSYDQPYDDYYGNGTGGYQGQEAHQKGMSQSSLPNFDAIPANNRDSFEQTMRPGPGQPQPGAHQTAKLNHAKSQPNLHQPQAAVFEMAGDIPAVPPVPSANPAAKGLNQGYGPAGHQRMPLRNPSAPPGATSLPGPTRMGPSPARSDGATHPSTNKSADSLPSHPTPVRAGLLENSVVNLSAKPPPVRNYGGVPQGPPQAQQAALQRQPQQQPPPQARVVPQKPQEIPVTPQELEHLRQVIKNNPNDQESALRLAKRLIEAADVLLPNLPDPKVRGRARERYVMDAHKILKKLSNAQNLEAMFVMADCLGRGLFGGSDSDTKEAFTLYQSAAKLGHAQAAYRTAVCCEIGQDEGGGTRKDPLKAIQWYKRAATLGDTPAMYKVGMILLKGLLGQPRNPREAVGWLKRAAERADPENPHALHELGLLYESAQPNDTIIRDERYALSLFEQAAELGYKFSQFRLGCAYEYGLMGCPIDPRMSIMWYSRAAQREEHQSELALSGWYLTGSEGVLKQSDQEAYLWARKAAVAGLAKAEYAMGYFTEMGIGVPPNLDDAKRWYWRAAAQDFPKARERLEDLKRGRNSGNGPRPREHISRSRIEKRQEGECSVM